MNTSIDIMVTFCEIFVKEKQGVLGQFETNPLP
jgi:hypothetical protein